MDKLRLLHLVFGLVRELSHQLFRGIISAILFNSSSVRFATVNPFIEVKSLTEEYLKLVNHEARFVFSDFALLVLICMLFIGVINILLVNASHPCFSSTICKGTFN